MKHAPISEPEWTCLCMGRLAAIAAVTLIVVLLARTGTGEDPVPAPDPAIAIDTLPPAA